MAVRLSLLSLADDDVGFDHFQALEEFGTQESLEHNSSDLETKMEVARYSLRRAEVMYVYVCLCACMHAHIIGSLFSPLVSYFSS